MGDAEKLPSAAGDQNWATYLLSYDYAGQEWGLDIRATSMEDAEQRRRAIRTTARLDGVLKMQVAVSQWRDVVLVMVGILLAVVAGFIAEIVL